MTRQAFLRAAAALLVAGSFRAAPVAQARAGPESRGGVIAARSAGLVSDTGVPLEAGRAEYATALARARLWLDDLHVDPGELRTRGIKGKKKLVEQLDAYYRLWKVAPCPEKDQLLERIREVVAVTYQDGYHDMASISDEWFKEDATSYLRAALLMERLGLDTLRYRQEIEKVHDRLDAHMRGRGPHQRAVFHWYYEHFGLTEPFPLAGALQEGVIAAHPDPASLTSLQAYDLTHEVYAQYEYGDRLDIDPFTNDEKEYLRGALSSLADRYMARDNPDVVAEVVECMHYLRLPDQPAYRLGVSFLLASQNQDGSWGSYPIQQELLGDYVRHGFLLHTTAAAIAALTAVFDYPMPPVAAGGLPLDPRRFALEGRGSTE